MSLIVKRNIAIVKKGVEAWVQQQPVVYVEPLCVARLTPRFDVRGFENVDLRAARGGAFAPKLDEFLAESALTDSREYYLSFFCFSEHRVSQNLLLLPLCDDLSHILG